MLAFGAIAEGDVRSQLPTRSVQCSLEKAAQRWADEGTTNKDALVGR